MSSSISRRELAFKAIAGLAGGALGWLPVELVTHGHRLTEAITPATAIGTFISMALLSGLIGGMVLAADTQRLEVTRQARRLFVRGFLICGVLALPAEYYENQVFGAILGAGGWAVGRQGSTFYLVIGRVTSWMMMGTILGAGVGLASFSASRMLKGALGGLIGGFVGGLGFDLIGFLSGAGAPSRLIGFGSIGLAIGLLIGLVQELTKPAWLTVEQGRLRGRQFRLERARATLGRAEENPVGLFGDPAVQQRHAVIERNGSDYRLRNLAVQAGTLVNGNRIETVDLHDGDRINIGSYELAFHLRSGSAAVREGASRQAEAVRPADTTPPVAGQVADGAGARLVDAGGRSCPLKPSGPSTVGRALDNDIVINDASVSRRHASLETSAGVLRVRDLNSRNGTYVGDRRVTEARIVDGESVRFGDAPFIFRA